MAIPRNLNQNENDKFVESSDVPGKPGIVVLNPDGSAISGGSGGDASAANQATMITSLANIEDYTDGLEALLAGTLTVDLGANNDVTLATLPDTAAGDLAAINSAISASEALRVDDTTTANVTYIGYAAVGTATSSASWKIKKIDVSSGTVITWADGDASYNNVWDNRASLSYS